MDAINIPITVVSNRSRVQAVGISWLLSERGRCTDREGICMFCATFMCTGQIHLYASARVQIFLRDLTFFTVEFFSSMICTLHLKEPKLGAVILF